MDCRRPQERGSPRGNAPLRRNSRLRYIGWRRSMWPRTRPAHAYSPSRRHRRRWYRDWSHHTTPPLRPRTLRSWRRRRSVRGIGQKAGRQPGSIPSSSQNCRYRSAYRDFRRRTTSHRTRRGSNIRSKGCRSRRHGTHRAPRTLRGSIPRTPRLGTDRFACRCLHRSRPSRPGPQD